MKKSYFLLLGLLTAVCGCSNEECAYDEMAHCNADGTAILICTDGHWKPKTCADGLACGYQDGVVRCLDEKAAPKCTPGEYYCENGVHRACGPDGIWRYQTCSGDMMCRDNACVAVEKTPVAPEPLPPAPVAEGLIKRECGADGHSIDYIEANGEKTNKTCLEEVGFDAECKVYGNGHVGCALPEKCDDVFSLSGSCIGNRLMWCDDRYINPMPSVTDCEVLGQVCSSVDGKSACRSVCEGGNDELYSCVKDNGIDVVTRCVPDKDGRIVDVRAEAVCVSEHESVACANGMAEQNTCADGEKCLKSTGRCALSCTAEEVDSLKCSETGEVLICTESEGEYAYMSMGKRHCADDHLYQCILDGSDYQLKDANCAAYVQPDGTVVSAKCVSDYQGYPDMDMCIGGGSGTPCGDLTDSGLCEGSVLKYCDEMNEAVASDCGLNPYGYTSCSVYAGYADCRMGCSKEGTAKCTYSANSESYLLTLCAPDDVTKSLTEIEGTAICLGDTLYTCDDNGNSQTLNCAANGGRCDVNRCVYPACSLDAAPVCLADNAMFSCEISADGAVIGTAFQAKTCLPNGECFVCQNGEPVASISEN